MASDMKGWDVYKDPLWLLHNLYKKYKVIGVPTNSGWGTSNVNGTASFAPFYVSVSTSVTASSRALTHTYAMFGLNSGTIDRLYVDWTKRLELSFTIARSNSDVEVVARVQLKEAITEGILAERGIGIQISNYTTVGEAYGTARGTTGTLKTLTDARSVHVKIVLTSASVEFWVDGVLVGSLTGTAVPAVAGAAVAYLVVSIINGVTGGVDANMRIGNIQLVQAW